MARTLLAVDRPERILLAVDLSYQVYRASASHPMLTSRRVFTGGLYGFMTTLAKMIRETRATDLVICQDRKPYRRSLIYPEYKQIRAKNRDDELLKMYTQSMKLVIEILEGIGMPIWGIDGFESDDLAAHAFTKYRHRFDQMYAGTNDSDIFQLLWIPNLAVYSKGINDLTTGASLLKKSGLTPDQFMLMTALTGTHNDIAGIDQVGPVTAKKAIADPQLMRQLRAKHADVIDRNLQLIQLPHPEFPREATLPKPTQSFDMREFYRAMGRYDIDVTNAMINSLEQILP